MCCSVLQCVAVCCIVLQCVAVRCSVLQCVAVCCSYNGFCRTWSCISCLLQIVCNDTAQSLTATHCNLLQRTATHHYNSPLQHTCNTLATHLQHTCNTPVSMLNRQCATEIERRAAALQRTATHCNALQHTAPHCNTSHSRTATHYNALQCSATEILLQSRHTQ